MDPISVIGKSETMRRSPQDILLPERYFRNLVRGLSPVPAYFYHQIEPREFERICGELARRGFHTLTFSQVLDGWKDKGRPILITMDDGWSSVWSVAFPIARRYGIRFTVFLVPMLVEDSEECRTTLDDGETPDSLAARDRGPRRWLTWGEVKAMRASGLVDVESHSLHHGVVFTSDSLVDFCTPDGPFPLHTMVPLVTRTGSEDVPRLHPAPGTPLYSLGPALAAPRRFIEDRETRERCIELAARNGGDDFFKTQGWRDVLREAVRDAPAGRWETEDERLDRLRSDLLQARLTIEERLDDARVRVLATPWAAMHDDLPPMAEEAGYELIVLGYPFAAGGDGSSIPLYPRLKGDCIWTLIHGPVLGAMGWFLARGRYRKRNASGAVS